MRAIDMNFGNHFGATYFGNAAFGADSSDENVPAPAVGTYRCDNPSAPDICYTIGKANEGVFEELQRQINRWVGKVDGLSKVGVDGKIGDGTAAALARVAHHIVVTMGQGPTNPMLKVFLINMKGTRQAAAHVARQVTAEMKRVADMLGMPAKPAATSSSWLTKAAAAIMPSTDTSTDADAAYTPGGPSSTFWWWVAGSAAVVGAGFVGYLAYTDRQKTKRRPSRRTTRVPY